VWEGRAFVYEYGPPPDRILRLESMEAWSFRLSSPDPMNRSRKEDYKLPGVRG
jgi:hypothetical protein